MLKPRTITAAIIFFFAFTLGVQHFVFSLSSQKENSDMELLNSLERRFSLFSWIERTDYDVHLRLSKSLVRHPDVVVVDVNERSIQELGQFPFARKIYAKLIENLNSYGARVAAFDITFPELERNDSLEALTSAREELVRSEGATSKAVKVLDGHLEGRNGDAIFATAIQKSKMPVILGFAFAGANTAGEGANDISPESLELLQKQFIFRRQVSDNSFVHSMSNHMPVIPHLGLLRALPPQSGLGFFTADPDSDSVIRSAVGVIGFHGGAIASLAVKAVSAYLGIEPALVGGGSLAIEDRNEEGKLRVPLSPFGSSLLRYYGGPHLFPYIEFSDVVSTDPVKQAAMRKALNGKLVFVGVSAVGLKDIRANPFSKDYPGVEVHATFASNMLTHSYMEKDQRYFFYGYGFLILIGCFVGFLVHRLHPLISLPLTLALIVVLQLATQDIFFNNGLVVPTFIPSLAALGVLFGGVMYRYFTEEREKKKVRSAFSRYVSGPVIEEILRDQSKLKLHGQKKMLTVMFCDLVGFTKLSEHMDATKLTLLLNEYFTRMTAIILRNQGTLDKYMGDAVMCFWGAPLDVPDHARLACKTAIEMTEELELINTEWKAKYDVTIGLRIGVHTGEMNVGNMGSEQVFSYTVMGDNVNLGSRLEGVNNVYGTRIMVSAATAKAAGAEYLTRTLDRVRVKGKEDAVEIAELVGFQKGAHPEWIDAFAAGIEAYQKGEWSAAQEAFRRCLTLKPHDAPTETFLARVEELKKDPPKDWDGTWTLSSK